eukprot:6196656-Pleurochrysis_carterae.AAC.2
MAAVVSLSVCLSLYRMQRLAPPQRQSKQKCARLRSKAWEAEPTLRAFNDFHQDFDKLYCSLPTSNRFADSLVADKLFNTVRKVSDGLRTLLDVQLAVNTEAGDLARTLTALRNVLGEHDAREICRQIELDKTGSAFVRSLAMTRPAQALAATRRTRRVV